MLAAPIDQEGRLIQTRRQLARDLRRAEWVIDLQAYARDVLPQTEQHLGIAQIDQRQTAVVFVHAEFEDAANFEALDARNHAGGRHHAFRRNQRDAIAGRYTKRARQIAAEHNAEGTRLQRLQ